MLPLLATAALANEYRFGLFVGNDAGLPGDAELVFAESDAAKMRDLFVEYGGIEPKDAVLLQGRTAGAVEHELTAIGARARGLVDEGHEAVVVFYYSGHGDASSLHLGATKLGHEDLRQLLENTGATVRIAMVDACQSGGLVRQKGGSRGPSIDWTAPVVEATHGTAIITSSAASELSQESLELGSGFFTHDLHTALTGGADADRDGAVTLTEAYAWVHAETSFRTRETPGTQTPSWDLDLAGAGEIVLTNLEEASAHLSFLGDLEGRFSVWDESRKRYVAEVDGGAPVSLAVRPGTFYVHQRMPGYVEEAQYTVRRGETHSVLGEDFETVSYASVASRGELDRMVRRAKLPDLSLQVAFGVRGFGVGDRGWSDAYVPTHGIGGVGLTFSRHHTFFGADVSSGGSAQPLDVPGLGAVPTRTTTTSLGGTIGVVSSPALLRAGIGPRASLTAVTRTFPEWELDRQASLALGVGWRGFAGIHPGRLSIDLAWTVQALVTRWDDHPGWPLATDVALVAGWRF